MEKAEVIKYYKDKLLNKLWLHRDYDRASGLRKKIILVEGATDKSFINHIIDVDSRCLAVVEFMRDENVFSTSPRFPVHKYSSKVVITTILTQISLPVISEFPKGAENWPLFGLVDNDFDDSNNYSRITKLFFTDTHDLETLMLSTDSSLLFRLEQCNIANDEVIAAFYIAKQLSAFRQAISNNGTLNITKINSSNGTIDFEAFIEENKISLVKILNYINSKMENPVPKEKIKRIHSAIMADMKRLLDKNGFWKKNLDSFSIENESWLDINGHDILAALRYKNPSAQKAFSSQGHYTQNRAFEFALSEAYDYNCLKNTKLYHKLHDAGLINL